MMRFLPVFVFGATVLVEQQLPDVRVEAVNPLSGVAAVNFRHADLDGDGLQDLVLARRAHFQREGMFRREDCVPLPLEGEPALCDVWARDLFLWFDDRLEMFRWATDAWKGIMRCPIPRPDLGDEAVVVPLESEPFSPSARFHRFLHDLDGDAEPEIVVAQEDGLHLYVRQSEGYRETSLLPIFPPLRVVHSAGQLLWPPEDRRVILPVRQMTCRFLLNGHAVTVLTREVLHDSRVCYRSATYTLNADSGGVYVAGMPEQDVSAPLPLYARPCRLNEDGRIDFAGGDWELAATSAMPIPVLHALPMPIYTTYASVDGGKTSHVVRTQSYHPRCSFVDFDDDGDLDMITEQTGLFEGGIREQVVRFMARRTIEHEIQVRLQDASGVFSSIPDTRARFTIRLDHAPHHQSDMFRRYRTAELVDVTGDLNGDGARDVVVQDQPERLAVYFNTGSGFDSQPDLTLPLHPQAHFGVTDVDRDGRSDIVVWWTRTGDTAQEEKSYVFFAREAP